MGVGCRCGWHLAFWIENKLTEEIGGTTQAPFLGFRAGGPNRPLWPQHSEAILLPRLGRREGGPAFLHRAPQAWLGRTFLLPNSQQSVPQKEPVYLEAKHIPPPVGSSPPLFRAASREALCWSKTSKNEASGPLGVKAIRTPLQQKRPTTRAPPGLRSPFSVPTMHLKGWGLEGQSSSPELRGPDCACAHLTPRWGWTNACAWRLHWLKHLCTGLYQVQSHLGPFLGTFWQASGTNVRDQQDIFGMWDQDLRPWNGFISPFFFFFLLFRESRINDFSLKQVVMAIQLCIRHSSRHWVQMRIKANEISAFASIYVVA